MRPALRSVLLASLLACGCARERARPPDVLVVTWDTVRADHVGPEAPGNAASATPRFDALAREGVRFSEARTPVPITLPAHASLFTGRQPQVHGARDNGLRVDPGLPTLAERFAAADYATAAFVSASVLDRRYGLSRGFAVYDDAVALQGGVSTIPERRGDQTVGRAIDWLAGIEAERPLFLWVHLYDPHRLWQAPAPFSRDLAPYPAEIAYADHQTGRLLDALAARGRLERCVVVVTSDHGEGLSEHGESTHSYFAYDSTLRVPLLFWLGEDVGVEALPGSRVAGPASLVDLAPTLLELAGLPALAGDGRSLRPQLTGAPLEPRELPLESAVPAFDYGAAPIFGLLSEGEIWLDLPRRERYDLTRDPGQTRNLYRAERDAARADALFARWHWAWPATLHALEPDAEARRQLERLGYLTQAAEPKAPARDALIDPKDRVELFEFLSLGAEALSEEDALSRVEALLRAHGPLLALERFRVRSLQALGRNRDALEALEALVRSHPEDAALREQLAALRTDQEQQRALASAIRQTLAAQPDHPSALRDLALTLHRLQQLEEAESLYQRALAREPENDALRADLARLLVTRRDHEGALRVADTGRRRERHDPALDCIAGRILADHLEREHEALPALRACRDAGGRLSATGRDLLARAR